VNNNRLGFFPRSYHPGAARGAGQVEAFCGGFNRPYQVFGSGAYGRRGGVNWFQHCGRGYGGNPMVQQGGFASFHRPQTTVLPPQTQQAIGSGSRDNSNVPARAQHAGTSGMIGFPNPMTPITRNVPGASPVDQNPTSSMIDISGLPPLAAGLLKQLLASMANKDDPKIAAQMVENALDRDGACIPKKVIEMGESSTQGEARASKVPNKPYCHYCLSKRDVKEDCVTPLSCEICTSLTHLKLRCPLQKKAAKVFIMTCRYAIDGLGFYYIPHQALTKPKMDHNAVIIRVIEGSMSGDQVAAVMDRLSNRRCKKWIGIRSGPIFNLELN
jgi:hypothetical protein